MSIAELIMTGTNRASESTAWVGDSLAKLGQDVSAELERKQQQKQAAEALPAMQAAYKSAMDDVAAGEVATGYQKFIDAQLQFGTSQNPFIADAANNVGGGFTNFVKVLESQKQRQAQYGGGGPVYEVPSMEQLQSGEIIPTRAVLPVMEEGGQPAGQPEAYLNPPSKQPYQGTPAQRAMQEAADREALDKENAADLPKKEPSQGESPFEFGFKTGSVSRYVASEKSRKDAADAFMNAVKATPEQRRATIKSITEETEVIPENAFRANMPQFGDGYFVGPSMEQPQKVISQKITEKFTRKGPESERTKDMGLAELTEAQNAFKEAMRTFGVSTSMFRYNPQLSKIMEAAGGDPTKIQLGEENIETEDGGVRTAFKASVNNVDLGELSTQVPLGPDGKPDNTTLSELAAVRTMIGAPDLVAKFGGKFIPIKKPAAAQPAAAGGLPAVQAQAPAAPEIPDVEGNPFAEKVKKIKTKETEEQKKVTTDEISRVVETTNRLQQALDGLAKGQYPKVMDYLPRAKKTALESSSIDALKNEYNVLASVKPAIEWLKKNPNHKDAARAAEVISKKLGI